MAGQGVLVAGRVYALLERSSAQCGESMLSRLVRLTREKRELVAAIAEGNVDGLKRLLDSGMSPDRRIEGVSLLTRAVAADQHDIVRLLLQYGAEISSRGNESLLSFATSRGNQQMVELGVKAGLNVNGRPRRGLRRGMTPLEEAISTNQVEMIDLLMTLGASAEEVRFWRWFSVSGDTIRRAKAWGVNVPKDVIQAAEHGTW